MLYLEKHHVKTPYHFKFNAQFPEGNKVTVESTKTGNRRYFELDEVLTSERVMANEGWDGEENHRYYRDTFNCEIILEIWNTPYDEMY